MAEAFGARPAAVARELTKLFEETRRAPLDALAAHYAQAGAAEGRDRRPRRAAAAARPRSATRRSTRSCCARSQRGVKEAASEAARELGVPRKRAYARALELKDRA